MAAMYMMYIFTFMTIKPPEIYADYGNMTDWENTVGTGPFVLTDYVPDQVMVLDRNPNYWMYDPLHPTNKLPYIDRQKLIVIKDLSTRISALKTGKIDRIEELETDQAKTLLQVNPDFQYTKYLSHTAPVLSWRHDVEPFSDIRVRRALSMAVDHFGVIRDYYGGEAETFNCYVPPYAEDSDIYVPFEDSPEDIKVLYEYHPDEARELLAEAGYPNGFKTEIVTEPKYAEQVAIIKEYWAKVGVDADMKIMEAGAFRSLRFARPMAYPQTIFTALGTAVPRRAPGYRDDNKENWTGIHLPGAEEGYEYIMEHWFEPELRDAKVREREERAKREAWYLPFVTPYIYRLWQPWVKGYHGEQCVGNQARFTFAQYLWIDADLKEAMK